MALPILLLHIKARATVTGRAGASWTGEKIKAGGIIGTVASGATAAEDIGIPVSRVS
jgi:hypothetical protein